MATPQEFMEQVVAWPGADEPGYVNLHWTSPKGQGVRGKPFRDLHEFMQMAQYAATKPGTYKEIYFCLSTQAITGKMIHNFATAHRSLPHAIRFKSIWLDIDVEPDPKSAKYAKTYHSLTEVYDGLNQFVTSAKLPPPSALVHSGGGVHVYWISDCALTKEEWKPFAEGLKAEAIRLGLKCDAGLTGDAARILRVPGTYNNKQMPARPVRLVHLGPGYDFPQALGHIAVHPSVAAPVVTGAVTAASAVLPFDISAFAGKPMALAFRQANLDPQFDSLAEGINLRSDLPLNPDEVFKGCVSYQNSAITHGAHDSEPLWNLTLLGATWFDDGRKWAHFMSKGYPTYTADETDKKFDDKLTRRANGTGWPSCSAFEGAGAKCKTCPFYGKLRSPLNLAERVQPPQTLAAPAPIPPDELSLPEGYTVNPANEWICQIVDKQLANGVSVQELVPLFMCKLRAPVAQRGTRKFMFETSLDGDHWGPVSLYEEDLATEQTLVKVLRRHGVKPFPDNQKRLVQFMTSWMAKLDREKKRIETMSFGWLRRDNEGDMPVGFAYGGRVVMNDGSVQLSGFSDAQIENAYQPKGQEGPWREALKIVTEQNHAPIEAIVAASFGAPLLFSTGLYNGIFCAWSPESGAHKSTSMGIGAAVWGSPVLTKERPLSTQKGVLRKLGFIRNLPVYWDEISTDEKMDEIREVLGILTEGSRGSVLHNDRTFYEPEQWQTLMLVGANRSLYENITRAVSYTDAQMQRVFEFIVPPRPDSRRDSDVSALIGSLDYNYGHMGRLYGELLGRDPAGIDTFVKKMRVKFDAEVDHKSPARFRAAMATVTWCGAALANSLGCDFHLDELWSFMKQQYMVQRDAIKGAEIISGTAMHTANTMTQFFKAHVRNVLLVETLPSRGKGKHPIVYIDGPSKDRKDAVHVRGSITERVLEVSKKELEMYLGKVGVPAGTVVRSLENHFQAIQVQRVDLAAGAGVVGGRETILRVPVPPGSPFEDVLFTNSQKPEGEAAPVTGPVTGSGPAPAGLPAAVVEAAQTAATDLALQEAAPSANSEHP